MPYSFTALAMLLGIATYPFFANHLPNQRQNACAVIGILLLGFLVFGHERFAELAPNTPLHAALKLLSFLFFACAFLGRRRGKVGAEKSALLPFGIGCLAALASAPGEVPEFSLTMIALQTFCLLAITHSYSNLPKITLVKAVYFSLFYGLVCFAYHLHVYDIAPAWFSHSSVNWLYNVLLATCVFHMGFQDFSRTRTRIRKNAQQKVDQEVMKLAFKGRRVLKDFRHDLRQPLSTLGILASVGKAISKDPEVTARYQHIQTAQKALKNMLEDFFDQLGNAIRYPTEEHRTALQYVALDEILAPLVEEYRMLAEVKQLQVRYVPTELSVFSNKEALSKIIRNGLDNAIKYTDKGGVVVGLRRRNGKMCLQIADTGSGIENDKVALHNKGWGHGSSIIRDLSEQILARTECRNRYYNGKLAGSVFEVVLPGEAEVSQRWKLPSYRKESVFDVQVMAMTPEHLLEIQLRLPIKGFDRVDFNLHGAYRAYLSALRKGMSPVYILYAGDNSQKASAIEQLKLLGSLLDFEPCCILIYNAGQDSNAQVEFYKEMIQIPMNPNLQDAGLHVITELFPAREKDTANSQMLTSFGAANLNNNKAAMSL
jgi:signal transduction histidine kinase